LFDVLRTTLLARPVESKFIYPKGDGNGEFCEKLKDKIESMGGMVITSAEVEKINLNQDHIESVVVNDGRKFNVKQLFWTAPISELISLIAPDKPIPKMEYISTVIANYMIDSEPQKEYQWCYFGTADSPVQRISIQVNFNPELAPKGKSGLCVELTCTKGDSIWNNPERMDALIEGFLVRNGMIRRYNDILDVRFEKIPNTYPLYTLNYKRKLASNLKMIKRYHNLLNCGRTGGFWYNNQDHSIKQALDIADAYIKDPNRRDMHKIGYPRTLGE
jgi:protoporphyrinogen oxidase